MHCWRSRRWLRDRFLWRLECGVESPRLWSTRDQGSNIAWSEKKAKKSLPSVNNVFALRRPNFTSKYQATSCWARSLLDQMPEQKNLRRWVAQKNGYKSNHPASSEKKIEFDRHRDPNATISSAQSRPPTTDERKAVPRKHGESRRKGNERQRQDMGIAWPSGNRQNSMVFSGFGLMRKDVRRTLTSN